MVAVGLSPPNNGEERVRVAERRLNRGALARKTERQLTGRWAAVNPLRLKLELESAQRTLAERAVQPVIAHPVRSEEI